MSPARLSKPRGYFHSPGHRPYRFPEGVVDHHVLTIHHVREGANVNEAAWDLGFLALGALLVLGGSLLARSDEREDPTGGVGGGVAELPDQPSSGCDRRADGSADRV